MFLFLYCIQDSGGKAIFRPCLGLDLHHVSEFDMVLSGLTAIVSLLLVDGLGHVQGQEVLLVLGGTDRIHTDGSGPGLH